MSVGICLTIGVNHPDRTSPAYSLVGFDDLSGCVIDSNHVREIATGLGFTTVVELIDESPTAAGLPSKENTLKQIRAAAEALKGTGGLFVIHFSGHGMQGLPSGGPDHDTNGNPISAWLLRDQPLASFELYQEWLNFDEGVRILVLSDSCHSGRAIKDVRFRHGTHPVRARTISYPAQLQIVANNPVLFGEARVRAVRSPDRLPVASVLLISGCRLDETSGDTMTEGGLFTSSVREVWNGGQFQGDYEDFHASVRDTTNRKSESSNMASGQHPDIYYLGAYGVEQNLLRFMSQTPFTV